MVFDGLRLCLKAASITRIYGVLGNDTQRAPALALYYICKVDAFLLLADPHAEAPSEMKWLTGFEGVKLRLLDHPLPYTSICTTRSQ